MLDVRREPHFKYDFKEVLAESKLPPEQMNSLYASTRSKGQNQDVDAAKAFLRSKVDEGVLTRDLCDRLTSLLDRYSRWR